MSGSTREFHLQPAASVHGRIAVPGDKSISHRAVMFGALARGTTHVSGFLPGADTLATTQILRDLSVQSVTLMTNNPNKLRELSAAGIQVTRRVPHWISETQHNQEYLAVKRAKLGHAK